MSDTAYAGYWEQIVPKQFIVQGLRQDVSFLRLLFNTRRNVRAQDLARAAVRANCMDHAFFSCVILRVIFPNKMIWIHALGVCA